MPSARKNSTSNTPKKSPRKSLVMTTPSKALKRQEDSSITPKKRRGNDPSQTMTPVKTPKKLSTPLKRKEQNQTESFNCTPKKELVLKLVRFNDAEVEQIEDVKQRASKKPSLDKVSEGEDDDETLEAFTVILLELSTDMIMV